MLWGLKRVSTRGMGGSTALWLLCVLALGGASFSSMTAAQGGIDVRRHAAGTGLLSLWASDQPALGFYVQPESPGDPSRGVPPSYSEETGRALAANPLPDFAFLSLEQHYDAQATMNVARGLRSGGVNSHLSLLVRIPPISEDGIEAARARVQEVLAQGANGVVIPHVLSAEEARIAISFFEAVNVWSPANPDGDIVVMLIVEDPPVFEELQTIASLPGYSSLVCGIGSLTSALNGDRDAAELINLQVLETAQRAGLPNMTTVDEASIVRRIQQGFLGLLAYGPTANDTLRLGRAAVGR